jgi:dephospho-CoA kinase
MLRVGLTGGIGTGKSYVLRRLRAAGVPAVDADILAREAVAPGSAGLAAVVERFGADVLTADGTLDRARLGALVFRDDAARRDLEQIVHPIVRRGIAAFFESLAKDTALAVADIPLLYETHRERQFDKVVVVACAPATQVSRVMARDGLSQEEAERRVAAQLPIGEKARRADYVIRTDGTHAETDAQIARLLDSLRS